MSRRFSADAASLGVGLQDMWRQRNGKVLENSLGCDTLGSMSDLPGEITQLLQRWQSGEEEALGQLMPLVYSELQKVARSHMRSENAAHTLQPTALANEAFLRLVREERIEPKDRGYFFGVVSRMMRRILIDHARHRKRKKRGGGEKPASLEVIGDFAAADDGELRAVDQAIEKLSAIRPLQAEIVRLRFFFGYGHKEAAKRLGISVAMLRREWDYAKKWLRRELGPPSR